jgi:hypothetical protein
VNLIKKDFQQEMHELGEIVQATSNVIEELGEKGIEKDESASHSAKKAINKLEHIVESDKESLNNLESEIDEIREEGLNPRIYRKIISIVEEKAEELNEEAKAANRLSNELELIIGDELGYLRQAKEKGDEKLILENLDKFGENSQLKKFVEGDFSSIEIIEESQPGPGGYNKALKHEVWIPRWKTAVLDHHNYAYPVWAAALNSGRIEKNATLIHIDQHRDMRNSDLDLSHSGVVAQEIPEYISQAEAITDKTEIAEFIQLSLQQGILKGAEMVGTPKISENNEELKEAMDLVEQKNNVIMDLDLDVFPHKIRDEERYKLIAEMVANANLVTIATSPGFINQEIANEHINRIVSELPEKREEGFLSRIHRSLSF